MRLLAIFLWWVLLGAAQPPLLDEWAARLRNRFEVPGVAVAIVKDGKVVATRGYGVRQLGKPEQVDEETLFGIASNTKAFTAAALAMLVDEGKLNWDDRVTKHLPGFALADPYVTRELTVRDLLPHRAGLGLGAGDLMFWPNTNLKRQRVLDGARHLRLVNGFRSRYAYNNTLYVVAGEVVAAVAGMPYEDFVRQRIFAPLGFGQTRFSNVGLSLSDNTTVPHSRGWRLKGELTPIPGNRDDSWAAAAGIKANVKDLARGVKMQLDGGRIEGEKRLFSEARSREMHAPNVILPAGPNALLSAYGLGWNLRDYQGRKVVSHGGGLTGMVSLTTLVPGEKLGVVVLTNQEEGGAMTALTNLILDHYLQINGPDWIETQYTRAKEQRERAWTGEEKLRESRHVNTKPSLEMAGYAGTYRDAWYGRVRVSEAGGKLRIEMMETPDMQGEMEHFHHDTFWVRWTDKTVPDALVTFALNAEGKVDRLMMKATSDLADFSFDYHDLDLRPEPKR